MDRVVRDGVVVFQPGGFVDPEYRRRALVRRSCGANLRRAADRAAEEAPDQPLALAGFAEDVRGRPPGDPRRRGLRADPLVLPDASGPRRKLIPEAAAARRARAATGDSRSASGDLRCRGRGVPRPLGHSREDGRGLRAHLWTRGARSDTMGRRLGRRRGRRRRPELDLGRPRTRSSGWNAAGSSTSACDGRGGAVAWPGRSRRRRFAVCGQPA